YPNSENSERSPRKLIGDDLKALVQHALIPRIFGREPKSRLTAAIPVRNEILNAREIPDIGMVGMVNRMVNSQCPPPICCQDARPLRDQFAKFLHIGTQSLLRWKRHAHEVILGRPSASKRNPNGQPADNHRAHQPKSSQPDISGYYHRY